MSKIVPIRHSLSHILAQAVQRTISPDVKLGVGPDIDNGFYYDILLDQPTELIEKVGEQYLKDIENQMTKIIKENQEIIKIDVKIDDAEKILEYLNQEFKIEMLNDLRAEGEKKISFYLNLINGKAKDSLLKGIDPKYIKSYEKINKFLQGIIPEQKGKFIVFIDMCKGPHMTNTKEIDPKAFKLAKLAGAYWRGDENNVMMTRIYGYAFENKSELKDYLNFLEEAKKRDHRVLGAKLGLYIIDPEVGLGLPLWKPKGATIVNLIKKWFEKEQLKRGYIPVLTPHIGRKQLWETSGHWGFYNDSMYPPIELGQTLEDYQDNRKAKDSEIYLLKPMNCPFHIKIYNSDIHSYREMPIKMYEFGTVYRYEQKGELGGLTRVRGFTQDDAHIICRQDQLEEEFTKVIDFSYYTLETFGFEITPYLSVRDPNNTDKYLGDAKMWDQAQNTIRKILKQKKIEYIEEEGEAAFYGPKVDLKVKDSIGRSHQLSTVQFDFNLPEKFDVYFVNESGEQEQPFVIHRALLGSLERFMGILIEHFEGAFPFWIAPVQMRIIPVSEKFNDYAIKLNEEFMMQGFRSEIDNTSSSFNKKIRNAEINKIPYILIIGEKEIKNNSISVREFQTKKQYTLSKDEFIKNCKKLINK